MAGSSDIYGIAKHSVTVTTSISSKNALKEWQVLKYTLDSLAVAPRWPPFDNVKKSMQSIISLTEHKTRNLWQDILQKSLSSSENKPWTGLKKDPRLMKIAQASRLSPKTHKICPMLFYNINQRSQKLKNSPKAHF